MNENLYGFAMVMVLPECGMMGMSDAHVGQQATSWPLRHWRPLLALRLYYGNKEKCSKD